MVFRGSLQDANHSKVNKFQLLSKQDSNISRKWVETCGKIKNICEEIALEGFQLFVFTEILLLLHVVRRRRPR